MKEKTVPMWLNISHQIEHDIAEGRYKDIDLLPTEIELCDVYGASRITIRAAMARLADQGKVKRIKGKGTVVNRKYMDESSQIIHSFSAEMLNKGFVPSTSIVWVNNSYASQYVNELFSVENASDLVVIERVRCMNDTPLCHCLSYLPQNLGLSLNAQDYKGSLYEMLDKKYNKRIDFIEQTITAEVPDKKVKEALNLLPGEPVLVIKRLAYHKNKLIEYSVSRYDSKRYELNLVMQANKTI